MFIKEEQFEIQLSDLNGAVFPASLDCEARYWNVGGFSHRACRITLRYEKEEVEGSDRDYFEAFCRVREQLEVVGLFPMCYAASRNVFPSGMARDMANGLRASRLRMGRTSRREDVVSIFDSGPDIDPVCVDTQQKFFDEWWNSPKS